MLGALLVLIITFSWAKSFARYSDSTLLKRGDFKVPRIDIEGWILLVLTVVAPLVAFSFADNNFTWSSPWVVVLLVGSPLVLVAFICYEAKFATSPIVDMTPMFSPRYLTVLVLEFLAIAILNAVRYGSTLSLAKM
jgi:hypothetical protein